MAIYVLLQCCKCNSQKRLHLYSCSRNKDDIYSCLCGHFNVRYSYTCKFGFFSLGWSIVLEVKIQCKKCKKHYNFGNNTFNSNYYSYDNHHVCCYNVFRVNVSGYGYASDASGLSLQKKQSELEEKLKKVEQEKKEKRKIEKIIETQNKETEKLKQLYNFDTDFIDSEMNQLLNSLDYKINNELNYDIEENIQKKNNLKFCKFEFH